MFYLSGIAAYRQILSEESASGYEGFVIHSSELELV